MSNDQLGKIGVSVITCDRPQFAGKLLDSLIEFERLSSLEFELLVVNDGSPLSKTEDGAWECCDKPDLRWATDLKLIQHDTNKGVAKTKNDAMKGLLDIGCEHIFVIEDDMIIKDFSVFELYVQTSIKTGIKHLNYGPGSPFNREQKIKNFDLHNRHLLDNDTKPLPRLTIDYGDGIGIDLYTHTVAMFTYYHMDVLNDVGLFDTDNFKSAFDHVDHTYRIIKKGYHPPFWWFADARNSINYIGEQPEAIQKSAIAKNEKEWMEEVMRARDVYKTKHGHYPNTPPQYNKEQVIQILKQLKK